MNLDQMQSKVTDHVEKKDELGKEMDEFRPEDAKVQDLLAESAKMDADIQAALRTVGDEFDAERNALLQREQELNRNREELLAMLSEEQSKTKSVQEMLDSMAGKRFTSGTAAPRRRANDILRSIDQMRDALGSPGDSAGGGGGFGGGSLDAASSAAALDASVSDLLDNAFPAARSAFRAHTQTLGKDFVRNMQVTLNQSKHQDVRAVYQKYGDRLTVASTTHARGAFYRPGEGVYMNSARVAAGDMIHAPYQTAFHEFGHNIDYLMGNGTPISETWNGGALYNAIVQDFDAMRGNLTNEQFVQRLRQEMQQQNWSPRDIASLSDIVESLTGISYPLGAGHGSGYWVNRLPCKEFFAETLDAAAANPGCYAMMQRFFPRSVSIVHQIIGGDIV